MNRASRARCAVLLVLLAAGCSGLPKYGHDRLLDLTDVADLRYGLGFGLGLSVEAGYFGTGLGCSTEGFYKQWFGRKSVEVEDGLFAHGLIVGFDGDYLKRVMRETWLPTLGASTSTGTTDLLVFHGHAQEAAGFGDTKWFEQPGGDPPVMTNIRLGGALFLPAVSFGLYLNAGEFVDLLAGVIGYDPMSDDGVPKYGTSEPEPAGAEPTEKAPVAPPAPAEPPAPAK